MSWTQRGMLVLVVAMVALIAKGRLSGSDEPGKSGGSSQLKGAVYAGSVPVYPGAKLTDVMGGNYYNEIGGAVTFTSTSWFFEVADPTADVVSFYRERMPQGYRTVPASDDETAFEWVPPDAAKGEDVTVTISAGQLQITESVKANGGS